MPRRAATTVRSRGAKNLRRALCVRRGAESRKNTSARGARQAGRNWDDGAAGNVLMFVIKSPRQWTNTGAGGAAIRFNKYPPINPGRGGDPRPCALPSRGIRTEALPAPLWPGSFISFCFGDALRQSFVLLANYAKLWQYVKLAHFIHFCTLEIPNEMLGSLLLLV